MQLAQLGHLTAENRELLEVRRNFHAELAIKPELFWPFLRPCSVKVLIVTDGGLDFSEGGFGLTTFVRTLLDMPGRHVRFQITLGHMSAVAASQMMPGETRIANRITSFKFDVASHFKADMYDEVFLFGIATSYGGRGTASNGQPYPSGQLADPELRVLTQFMNAGGGLFATGDHGALGRALCHAIPRARNMRLWASTSAQTADDEVSMGGPRRNDTNRLGDAGSQFNDQSDDIPQPIQPKMYLRKNGLFKFSFPHPLLCGPKGVIRVMPDHPHEGECIEPANPNLNLNIGGALGPEYPAAIDAGTRPLPEIISTNSVLSGTTSGGKQATIAQTFGGITAYDGHRAGVGRVVTDATWHHFVNINLTGDPGAPVLDPKRLGFLASPAGQAHFEAIKAYYRNLAVWLARPERIACMNTRLVWWLVWNERVMEAVLSTTDVKLATLEVGVLALIGKHARDVLGQFAGQCQSVRLIFDLVLQRAIPKLIPEIDPWLPEPERLAKKFDGVQWFDASPVLDIAFGGALVALREAFQEPEEKSATKLETSKLQEVMQRGAVEGLEMGFKSAISAAALVRAELKLE